MPPKRCPRCGAIQQWTLWQRCFCGYDFGPPEPECQSASAFLHRFRRPRFIKTRFAVAVVVEVAAVAVAVFFEPVAGPALAMLGQAVPPYVVKLEPVRTLATEWLWVLIVLSVIVIAVLLRPDLPPMPIMWRVRFQVCVTIVLAAAILWRLPKQYRELMEDLASRG
jgi:hypothetical protein